MISYIAIVVVLFIPLFCAAYAKFSKKGYDNHSPREFLATVEGRGKRANFAQQNGHEAFAPFAVGIVVAHQLQVPASTIDLLACLFVMIRVLYSFAYIYDLAVIRSLVWFAGFAVTIALYCFGLKV